MCVYIHICKYTYIKKKLKIEGQRLTLGKEKMCGEVAKCSELKLGVKIGRENCLPKSLRADLISLRTWENAKLILQM